MVEDLKIEGKDFEQSIYKYLGNIEMIDQIKGYNYLKSLPYVDSSRIALHGWSYGIYDNKFVVELSHLCGVAGGPVTDWSLYEVMYTERYMQTPNKNKDGYASTNILSQVNNLNSNLLMIHGLIDDVVVVQHSLKFIEKCIENNIPIDYFLYPNHPHNVRGKR